MRAMLILHSTQDEYLSDLNNTTSKVTPERTSTYDNVLQLLGLCLLLIIILIAAYYTSRFVGRYKLGQLKEGNIQVIESYAMNTNSMLHIVKIANKYLVLGVSKEQITYITELDEDDIITHEVNEDEKLSFHRIFEKLKGNKE